MTDTRQRRKKHPKLKGELSEVRFMFKALLVGLIVSQPYGDNARYDFIVDNGPCRLRVQVKSTSCLTQGLYGVHVGRHKKGKSVPYTNKEVDFIAVHVVPDDRWYIIPVAVLAGRTQIYLHRRVNQKKARGRQDLMSPYLEAWGLLKR